MGGRLRTVRMLNIYLSTAATYMVTADALTEPRPKLPAAVMKCIEDNAEWLRGKNEW